MGNFITSRSFATVASVTASSSLTSAPAANVLDYSHPFRLWRASAAIGTADSLDFDFGVAKAITAVVIDNINSTSIKVQFGATVGATTVNDTVTVAQDGYDGRYKAYHTPTGSPVTYRYMRILNNTTSTTDGSRQLAIGSILCLTAITTWDENTGFPFETEYLEATEPGADFSGGGREPLIVGNPGVAITLPNSTLKTSMETTMQPILAYGTGRPFVFYRNHSRASEVYIVRRTGATTLSQGGPNHFVLGATRLEEVL